MRILILGGNGFIGRNLLIELKKRGHEIVVLGHGSSEWCEQHECKFFEMDFRQIDKYETLFIDIDVVYHLVNTTIPQSSNKNPVFDVESNVIGTINLLNICVKYRVKKIIYVSSGGTIYGIPKVCPLKEEDMTNPICSYGISKLMIEKYLALYWRNHGLNYKVVRLSNPYGPWQKNNGVQGVIGVFIGKILNNEKISIWGKGDIIRDYIYIGDVVEAMAMLVETRVKSNIFNLGSGIGVTLNQLVEILEEVTGREISVDYRESRNFDIPVNILDISKIQNELNWKCNVDLKMGIMKTLHWQRNYLKYEAGR